MAWSGLLSNFAAGVFMIVLRPFKVGDMITVNGITGVVHEIGLFVTSLDTPDNIRTFIGNNKIFSDTISNYTTNPFRRVELTAQLAHGVNPQEACRRLQARLTQIPNVVADPAPSVEILTFTAAGPVLAVRPFCHNNHYSGRLLCRQPSHRGGVHQGWLPGGRAALSYSSKVSPWVPGLNVLGT